MSTILLTVMAPIGSFATALILRIAADAQPETAWSAPRRKVLLAASYSCLGIGFLGTVISIYYTPVIGGALLLLFALGVAQLVDVEAVIAGQRRRAQQAELLWMLASTVRDNGNLADELELYASGAWGWRHRRLMEVAGRLREGIPLTEIAVPQGLLPASTTLEIQAGLQGGRLHQALRSAALRHTREMIGSGTTAKAQISLMHPAAIMTVTSLILGFLLIYIVPKFKKIFAEFGTELPPLTRMLLALSDSANMVLVLLPLIYLPIIAAVIIGFAEVYGWRSVAQRMFGAWSVRPYTADLLRSLSQSIAAGIPLPRALEGQVITGSHLLRQRLAAIRVALEQGDSCWKQLEFHRFLNCREAVLLESAERVGNLPQTLAVLASAIERRWSTRLSVLLELFGPAMVVVVGIVVAFLAAAVFLPLVQLLNHFS